MTDDDGPAGPADPGQVAARLRLAVAALVRATRGADVLAPIPAAVLDLLDREGPMTTADLAARRQVRHQTMAATVRELHDLGYVAAVPDGADGRKKLLSLTAAGRAVLDDDRQSRVRRLAEAIGRTLSNDERSALAQALPLVERISVTITEETVPPRPERPPITGDW
ncbi:MAG TPA: MarR family transcriptional regulator [Streptosporangiaceae bacterium]|nr:MarR family transcriptional regulator [Streptosporangiaceae bacterium]